MRHSSPVVFCALMAVACSSDGPTGGDRVSEVQILRNGAKAAASYDVDYFGEMTFQAVALNGARVQLPDGSYNVTWRSDDGATASVLNGHVTVSRNGTARIIAQSGDFADTVVLNVTQVARESRVVQDTIVALTPGATKLSGAAIDGGVQMPDTVRFAVQTTDIAGSPAPSTTPIQYTNLDPAIFTIVPNAKGDTVKIIGVQAGTGRLKHTFMDHVDTAIVQVASSYAVVQMSQGLGQASVNPASVTIPVGAAVLFQNTQASGNFLVLGTGWRVGPIPGRLREANVFNTAGTFAYTMSDAAGTITVTP